jgi:hypothetical protein
MVRLGSRPNLHERFRQVVARAVARAEREHAEHLAGLRPRRRQTSADRRRLHVEMTAPPPRSASRAADRVHEQ